MNLQISHHMIFFLPHSEVIFESQFLLYKNENNEKIEFVGNGIKSSLSSQEFTSEASIPVLDEVITPYEVKHQMKLLHPDKACGPDGLAPGILKLLPAQWILLLTNIFNSIIFSEEYPLLWINARLCTIFKKGDRGNARNCRGISIINCMAKLYDMILYSRLKL